MAAAAASMLRRSSRSMVAATLALAACMLQAGEGSNYHVHQLLHDHGTI
jgi:hypothetical protein